MRAACVALALLIGHAGALVIAKPKMDNHKCKTMCQRFGMKALGPEFGDNPTACCAQCDKVYKGDAFLQVNGMPKAAPKPESSPEPVKTPPKTKSKAPSD